MVHFQGRNADTHRSTIRRVSLRRFWMSLPIFLIMDNLLVRFISAARLCLQGAPDETFQLWKTGEAGIFEYLKGLSYVQRLPRSHDSQINKPYQFPSWVPDFGTSLFANRLWSSRFKAGITSAGAPRELRFLNAHALEISAMFVDEVVAMDVSRSEPWKIQISPRRALEVILTMLALSPQSDNREDLNGVSYVSISLKDVY